MKRLTDGLCNAALRLGQAQRSWYQRSIPPPTKTFFTWTHQ